MYKSQLILFTFLLLNPLLALSQSKVDDEKKENPFKRSVVFAPTIDELTDGNDSEEFGEDDVKRKTQYLSVNGLDLGGGFAAGPYYSNQLYNQYPNLSTLHYNRVNGLFIGLKKERMQWYRRSSFLSIPGIQPHGFVGIGTASGKVEYGFGLERLFGEERRFMAGAEYHRATATEDYWRTGLIENSLSSLFAAHDYLDYYQLEGLGIYTVFRTQRFFEMGFSFNSDEYSSLGQNTSFSLFGYARTYRPNPAVDQNADVINLDKYSFSIGINPRNASITDRFTASSTIGVELADNSQSDEDYRYDKYLANINLFYNVDPGSVLKWRLRTGSITGTAPDFKSFYLGGIGSLRGTPFKFYSGNQMVHSTIEMQFGSPGNHPGSWVRDYDMHLLVFLDSGWTSINDELTTSNNPFEGFENVAFSDFQHDAGLGIGTSALRFEAAWPLNNFDGSPNFWVRFNPTF
ncbi:MAG: hypothetical protein WEA58_02925 [Balneolaceae bacterium]